MAGKIYQLTEYQFDILKQLSDTVGIVPLPDLKDTDDAEVKERIGKQRSDLHDLAVLGLIKDSTNNYLEVITATELKTGRGFEVYTITDIGSKMFAKQKFKIN